MFHLFPHKTRKVAPKIVHNLSTNLDGRNFKYKFVQSPAAHSVRLRVSMQKGLEIIVPRRFHLDHAQEIVEEHQDWIIKQLHKLEQKKQLRDAHQLQDGAQMTVLGQPHTIKIIELPKGKKPFVKRVQKLEFSDDSAAVAGHEFHVYCDGTMKQAKAALEKYLRKIAEKYFAKHTATMAQEMGVTFNNITVRGQKTRWGSCTREKNLNFNWRLIMLPLPVAESVVIHELAHTIHMNHSKAFYGLVERFCPDYRKLQKHLHNPQFLV